MVQRIFLGTMLVLAVVGQAFAEPKITWVDWSPEVFARAKAENKLIILDLEAVWCHWCHVMEKETYSDPEVQKLIGKGFIAVRVDQDSRPDLSNRYEDYGWPATVIYNSKGEEIVKLSGYIPKLRMRTLLAACIEDPTPGPSVTGGGAEVKLAPGGLKGQLLARLDARYDRELGGWSDTHKYLDWDAAEANLRRDNDALKMARTTMDAQLGLIDPVWGGVYQYSDGGVWKNPHFEKIMSMQAENMRIFSLGYAQFGDARYRDAAQAIHRYLVSFLTSPQGAFYTSQDADVVQGQHSEEYFRLDDKGRRAHGIPRVDQHVYARENGWAIQGLCALYAATGDASALEQARKAADWIIANRSIDGGGFRHDERDKAGPYLGDTLAMGRAFLALYGVTGDRAWLARAEAAAGFIEARFKRAGNDGYGTSADSGVSQVDENIGVARFTNLLYNYSGKAAWKSMTAHARACLEQPAMAVRNDGGVFLALDEIDAAPLHVTVVGSKKDPAAAALFAAALRCPNGYRRIEWLDVNEGALPNNDVEFPQSKSAAAYLCTDSRCSRPIVDPAALAARWKK